MWGLAKYDGRRHETRARLCIWHGNLAAILLRTEMGIPITQGGLTRSASSCGSPVLGLGILPVVLHLWIHLEGRSLWRSRRLCGGSMPMNRIDVRSCAGSRDCR